MEFLNVNLSILERDAKDDVTKDKYDPDGNVIGEKDIDELEAELNERDGKKYFIVSATVNGHQQIVNSCMVNDTVEERGAGLSYAFHRIAMSLIANADKIKPIPEQEKNLIVLN